MVKNVKELYRFSFCGWSLKSKELPNGYRIRATIVSGCKLPMTGPPRKVNLDGTDFILRPRRQKIK